MGSPWKQDKVITETGSNRIQKSVSKVYDVTWILTQSDVTERRVRLTSGETSHIVVSELLLMTSVFVVTVDGLSTSTSCLLFHLSEILSRQLPLIILPDEGTGHHRK